ncbi:MAG: hypothetical protein QXT58_03840, partial [Archaeoglobaceae archaeon]
IWVELVRKILKKEDVSVVAFGHTHRPEVLRVENGKYYFNAGSWHKQFTYGTIDDEFAKILRYDKEKEIVVKEVKLEV